MTGTGQDNTKIQLVGHWQRLVKKKHTRMKMTKQGVRDLNTKQINGRDKGKYLTCQHIWSDWKYSTAMGARHRQCVNCGEIKYEELHYW